MRRLAALAVFGYLALPATAATPYGYFNSRFSFLRYGESIPEAHRGEEITAVPGIYGGLRFYLGLNWDILAKWAIAENSWYFRKFYGTAFLGDVGLVDLGRKSYFRGEGLFLVPTYRLTGREIRERASMGPFEEPSYWGAEISFFASDHTIALGSLVNGESVDPLLNGRKPEFGYLYSWLRWNFLPPEILELSYSVSHLHDREDHYLNNGADLALTFYPSFPDILILYAAANLELGAATMKLKPETAAGFRAAIDIFELQLEWTYAEAHALGARLSATLDGKYGISALARWNLTREELLLHLNLSWTVNSVFSQSLSARFVSPGNPVALVVGYEVTYSLR